jgi:hypothetical protein
VLNYWIKAVFKCIVQCSVCKARYLCDATIQALPLMTIVLLTTVACKKLKRVHLLKAHFIYIVLN